MAHVVIVIAMNIGMKQSKNVPKENVMQDQFYYLMENAKNANHTFLSQRISSVANLAIVMTEKFV